MNLYWMPLNDHNDTVDSIGSTTINQTAASYVAGIGDSAKARIEWDTPENYPNLVFSWDSTASTISCSVNGIPATASLIGGSHSPIRPR